MGWAIWYHLYNLENVKKIRRGVLLLVKLQAPATLLKLTIPHECFSRFLNHTNGNGTKSRKTPQLIMIFPL